jgi:hypothetical protein
MTDEQLDDWRVRALCVEEEVSKAIVGQQPTVRLINVAIFARGHVLLEGDVGVGKTRPVRQPHLYWIPALMALLLLAVRFAPFTPARS